MSPAGRSSPPPEPPAPVAGGTEAAGRAAIFVLPILSVLVAALAFLGPGGLHAATGVRVRGLPVEGGRALALRVEVVRSFHDVVDTVAVSGIEVEASAPGQVLSTWRGAAGPDGIAEARLEAREPLRGSVAVAVTAPHDGRTAVLASGEIPLRAPASARSRETLVQSGLVRGAVHGDLAIRVEATRGVLASPFAERMHVAVSSVLGDAPVGRAEIELSGPGLEVAPARLTTDERGIGAFDVKALAHNVELSITARAGDKTARWEGTLPVVPGALWLDPALDPASPEGVVSLVSAVPRERAYLSLWSEEGRIFGAVVPLVRDGFGFFRGQVTAKLPPSARLVYATVAGDPVEQGSGTVAWPIRPAAGAVARVGAGARGLEMLLDGVPAAVEREKLRAWAARRAGLLVIGAAALAEVLLLLSQSRTSQRRLDAHLLRASATLPEEDRRRLLGAGRESPLLRASLAMALVGLGFALVAALSTFR